MQAGVLAALLVASPALAASEPAMIRVGMDTRSRPWAFVPGLDYSREDWTKPPRVSALQLKRLEGVDIDFMKALAGRMNVVPQVVPWPWDSIEEGLSSKQFDLLINAWAPSDRTPASIVGSSPYCEWGLSDRRAVRQQLPRIVSTMESQRRRASVWYHLPLMVRS